jgi:hypothetical protein
MRRLFIIVSGILLTACTEQQKDIHISVLKDVTEADFVQQPNYDGIAPQFGLQENIWQGVQFRYTTISDVQFNNQESFGIPGESSLLGNAFERKKTVEGFLKRVKQVLESDKSTQERGHSSIWRPVVRELIQLQEDSMAEATIYLFSDLAENSDMWSAYRPKDVMLFDTDFNTVKDRFLDEAQGVRRDQGNVQVNVVFQPKDMDDDRNYQKMVRLYSALFQELGIPIEFVANL